MGTVAAKFLAGATAGLLVWAIMEPSAPASITNTEAWEKWEGLFFLLLGALVGLVVGGYDGYTRGGKVHLLRGLGLGFLFGAIGGSLGDTIGGRITQAIFGPAIFSETGNPVMSLVARTLVLAFVGMFIGAAIGASSLNPKKIIQGAIGGVLGGSIGGFLFEVVGSLLGAAILAAKGQTSGEVGGPSRAIVSVLMGGAIGLFIGLVERLTRSAWIRISYGRNEYKEWSIDSAQTFIGRNESATIPLMGDPHVQPVHAVIQRQGRDYFISDGGSQVGTKVNGQFVQQAALAPGSLIQIAGFTLQFLVKGIPAPALAHDMAGRGSPYPRGGVTPAAQSAAPTFAPAQPPQPSAPNGNQTVAYGANSSPSMMGFTLVAMDGPLAGQKFPVTGAIEVGREAANIRLTGDTNASRHHASISPGVGGVKVTDLNSTNGTYINGQKVTTADARPGDLIKIGAATFRVEAG